MNLASINQLSDEQAHKLFTSCCFCERWARDMTNCRPFLNEESLFSWASQFWETANEEEILEAFSAHPKIGDLNALRDKYASHAKTEQGQITAANESTLKELNSLNQDYETKFGFIFIVCAKGKSASAMLTMLKSRIINNREIELKNGATEQGKITALRLQKLLDAKQ